MKQREILRLAIPAIISNITTPLLGLADTAIVGHIGAAAYIGAIAVGGSMFNLMYWLLGFLRMGSSGMTAQAYGARGDTSTVLYRGLVVAAIAAVALIVLSPLICRGVLWFMDADALTADLAGRYFRIVIFGAPAVLGTYVLAGWYAGMQNARTPMWMAIITNVGNIALSAALVFGLGLKIEGVATGTLVAQWVGFGYGLWRVRSRLSLSQFRAAKLGGAQMRRFFSLNLDIFLRTLCMVTVTLWFTRAGAKQGADILAANALLMQLFLLYSYFMDGFAFAGEALAGKYLGRYQSTGLAADRRDMFAVIRRIFAWGIGMALTFTALYYVSAGLILRLLTDDASVVATSATYAAWAVAVPVAGMAAFIWDGVYIGMTMTRRMLVAMAVAMVIFFAVYYLLTPTLGNHALWLAFILYLATRGVAQTVLFRQIDGRVRSMKSELRER